MIDPSTRAVTRTITLARGSQPFGIVMSPVANVAYVTLEAGGQILKFDTTSYAQTGSAAIGLNARHLSISGDGARLYVSRFVTPPLPGEGTATVTPTASTGGEVLQLDATSLGLVRTIVLQHSDKDDGETQGRGIPNYLGAAVISPDGSQAYVPSKQDNVKRGALRDGTGLNFQNTVRAISSRIDLAANSEDLASRIDHDNASVATAAVYEPHGVYLFVALETSREVAVLDAFSRQERLRFDVGRAPQGLAISADGLRLYVNNFMDRTVGVYDLAPLLQGGQYSVPLLATLPAVATEKLAANVLAGKKLFYDARDPRLAMQNYMSCASCHNDGGQDGRVWDLTAQGEGLRNTIALRGRAGMGQGFLHWSNNFDEVQDFEGQIRALAGGTGLMSDADFAAGTRSAPLGTSKAGLSADLDALAAYVASLNAFAPAPARPSAASLSADAAAGKAVFTAMNCAACHSGAAFTGSGLNTLGQRRHDQAFERLAPVRRADRHRHPDAARRLGHRPLPARRLGAHARGRGPRAQQRVHRRCRPGQARRLPEGDRRRRAVRPCAGRCRHRVDRQLLQQHLALRHAGADAGRGGRFQLGQRVAGNRRGEQQLLDALDRPPRGPRQRYLPRSDCCRRRRARVGQRRTADRPLAIAWGRHTGHERPVQSECGRSGVDRRGVLARERLGDGAAAVDYPGQHKRGSHTRGQPAAELITILRGLVIQLAWVLVGCPNRADDLRSSVRVAERRPARGSRPCRSDRARPAAMPAGLRRAAAW